MEPATPEKGPATPGNTPATPATGKKQEDNQPLLFLGDDSGEPLQEAAEDPTPAILAKLTYAVAVVHIHRVTPRWNAYDDTVNTN